MFSRKMREFSRKMRELQYVLPYTCAQVHFQTEGDRMKVRVNVKSVIDGDISLLAFNVGIVARKD